MTKPSRTSTGRSARYAARNPAFTLSVDLDDFNALIAGLEEDVSEAVRPAAQAGAQILYDEVKRNVARLGSVTGNLESSIYQAYSENNSGPGRATYHVSWNSRKAPHGHLIERGHIQRFKVYLKDGKWYTNKDAPLATPRQVAARPFVRPAASRFPQAEAAVVRVFWEHMNGKR